MKKRTKQPINGMQHFKKTATDRIDEILTNLNSQIEEIALTQIEQTKQEKQKHTVKKTKRIFFNMSHALETPKKISVMFPDKILYCKTSKDQWIFKTLTHRDKAKCAMTKEDFKIFFDSLKNDKHPYCKEQKEFIDALPEKFEYFTKNIPPELGKSDMQKYEEYLNNMF